MAFRYPGSDGTQRIAPDVEALAQAIRSGEIAPDTAVLDDAVNVRLKAGAIVAMHRRNPGVIPPAPAPVRRVVPPLKPAAMPEPADDEETLALDAKRVRKHRFMAAGVGLAALWLLGYSDVSPSFLGEQTGRGLFILLVTLLIFGFLLGKKTPRQKIRLAWIGAIVWSVFMLAPIPFGAQARKERLDSEKQAMRAIADSGRKSLAQLESLSKGEAPAADASATIKGDDRSTLGKAAPVMQAYQKESMESARRYLATIEAIGLDQTLTPATLTTSDGIAKNRQRFERYLAELAAQKKRDDALVVQYRGKLVDAMGATTYARGFLDGFDDSIRRRNELEAEWAVNQTSLIAQMSAVNEFMAGRRGSVTVQGDQLMFATQADLDRYRQAMAPIERLAKEEEALVKKKLERDRLAIEKLEEIASRK